MRRMTGAILIDTRPDRMIMSAWRGEARNTSAPKRLASTRGEPTTVIISIAQQASPKVSGNSALARAQFCAFSSVVRPTRSSTYWSRSSPSSSPRSIWRARSCLIAQVVRPPFAVPGHLHSSAPLRHTNTNATNSSTMNVITSPSA